MKAFVLWCAVFFGLYAGCSAVYHAHLTHHPRRVVVALDTSFPMQAVWAQVPGVLQTLQQQRYTVFSLLTDKRRLHGWQPQFDLGGVQPYAPRDLTTLLDRQRYPEIATAQEGYVITNAPVLPRLPEGTRWHVVQLRP